MYNYIVYWGAYFSGQYFQTCDFLPMKLVLNEGIDPENSQS